MKFTYENERGKIVMHGGGEGIFNIIEIRGLSLPENDIDSVYYPQMAGCIVEKSTPQERVITISADAKDTAGTNILRAMNVFSIPGTTTITSGGRTRKIFARCLSFETNKRKGIYVPFVLQLMAENPYFQDVYDTEIIINKREKMLSSSFMLPCAVSIRKVEALLVNKGDVPVEPTFVISSGNGAVCPDGIVIENLDTGAKIKLNTNIGAGETIEIDVKNRRITSNKRGNIISCLDEETSITSFLLQLGVSTVKISAQDIEGDMHAVCKFNNNYICASL